MFILLRRACLVRAEHATFLLPFPQGSEIGWSVFFAGQSDKPMICRIVHRAPRKITFKSGESS
jgi:hypothetical protein